MHEHKVWGYHALDCAARAAASLAMAVGAAAFSGDASAAWSAEVLWVQSYGVDTPSCGTSAAPCRSITRALARASPGATIHIGPGRYGDVNGNGELDAGDEGPPQIGPTDYYPALLRIVKSVRINSTHGAEVTTLDVGPRVGATRALAAVRIAASDVELGALLKGLRVVAGGFGGDGGIDVMAGTPISNVRISGNIVDGGNYDEGVDYSGEGIGISGLHESVLVTDNQVSGFGQGLRVSLYGADYVPAGGPATVTRNTIYGNGTGLAGSGRGVTITANIAHRNRTGISVDYDVRAYGVDDPPAAEPVVDNNYVIDNVRGLSLQGGGAIVRNAIIGNLRAGVFHTGGTIPRVELNNVYGNGLIPTERFESELPVPANCAIFAQTYYSDSSTAIVAVNNFWGSPQGPGPDPADYVGPGTPCYGDAESAPFATTPFAVPVPVSAGAPRH